jgi:hypothetical protein
MSKKLVSLPRVGANAAEDGGRVAIGGEEIDRTTQSSLDRPTMDAYGELERAFDYFNEALFRKHYGVLLPCVILSLPKNRRTLGYFMEDVWGRVPGKTNSTSEIALNLRDSREPQDVLGTLVHEMVHLAQANRERQTIFGKPGQRGYHSKAFAKVMATIGLMASNTGQPGGKRTGYQMTHYVIEGGPFDLACREYLASGGTVSWVYSLFSKRERADVAAIRLRKTLSKTKYSCPACSLNVWAKPEAYLICGLHGVTMISEPLSHFKHG